MQTGLGQLIVIKTETKKVNMKKIVLILTGSFFLGTNVQAQNGAFKKADKLLNIGVGINSPYDRGIPLGASFEKGITDNISVGVNVDYLSSNYRFGSLKLNFTTIYLAARGSYHFNNLLKIKNEKIDVYAGPSLGYRIFSWKDNSDNSLSSAYGSGLYLGVHVGGKYYFTDKIGVFAEVGDVGSTNARLGVAFKF